MDTSEVKSVISNIIGVPVSGAWDIIDSKPEVGLYLVHYQDNVNMNTYGHIRGIIVDIDEKIIVCDAYRYTPIIKSDHLEFNDQGQLELYDTLGKKYIGYKDKIRIVPGFEVVTIRVFLHRGIVYYSTYRKINVWTSGSRWGESMPFSQMALDLKIPSAEQLFPNKSVTHSNYVHIFMLVHQGILNVTKADIGNGYIVYAGTKTIWDPCTSGISQELIDTTPVILKTTDKISEAKENLTLLKPEDFNLNQANLFLNHGYYGSKYNQADARLNGGEFVIIYLDVNSPFSQVIRVESTSYRWRSFITDDHPNLKYRYFQLLNMTKSNLRDPQHRDEFLSVFPQFTKWGRDSVIKKLEKDPIHFWVNSNLQYLHAMSPEDKMYNVWIALLMAVPLHKQKLVVPLYEEYMKNKIDVVNTIYSHINSTPDEEGENHRFYKIIELAKKKAIKDLNLSNVSLTESSEKDNYNNQVKYNIQYLINNEEGTSLYRIWKNWVK